MGKAERTKGKDFERQIVEFVRVYGYEAHRTSQQDKALDELGVDIMSNTPFHIQCKAVERLNMSHHQILKDMPTDKIPVVMHKRNNKGIIVAMKIEDFANLLLYKEKQLCERCTRPVEGVGDICERCNEYLIGIE